MDGAWKAVVAEILGDIDATASGQPPSTATTMQEVLMEYLSNEGSLPWQVDYINRV